MHLNSSLTFSFEPFLRAALKSFVEAYIPSYARALTSNQPRDFWLSFYNLDAINKYILINESFFIIMDVDFVI